jgi:hypothetical protein
MQPFPLSPRLQPAVSSSPLLAFPPQKQDFRDEAAKGSCYEAAEGGGGDGLALSREAVAGAWRRALEQLRAASDLPHLETVAPPQR